MPEKRTEVRKIDPDASLENKMLAVAGHTPKQIQELTSINIGGGWVGGCLGGVRVYCCTCIQRKLYSKV